MFTQTSMFVGIFECEDWYVKFSIDSEGKAHLNVLFCEHRWIYSLKEESCVAWNVAREMQFTTAPMTEIYRGEKLLLKELGIIFVSAAMMK